MNATTSRHQTSTVDDRFVHEVPGVCGGYPILRNTRIPVRAISEFHRQGADMDEIAVIYPHISKDRIQGALDYYAAHPARVDEDMASNERSWAEIIARNVHIQGRPCPD